MNARRSFNLALAASGAVFAAWLFCVLAHAFGWHSAVTGLCAAVLVVPLVACAVWLNRAAGKNDDGGGQE